MKSNISPMRALIALGANDTGESHLMAERLQNALRELASEEIRVEKVSHFYHSPCFPEGIGNDFVNAVALLKVRIAPEDLLIRLHEVEANAGRKRLKRWGIRPLDLDLLAVEKIILPDFETFEFWRNLSLSTQMERAPEEIILPHPRITDRAFVLLPMRDVVPDWVHPVTGQSLETLISALPEGACDGIRPIGQQKDI